MLPKQRVMRREIKLISGLVALSLGFSACLKERLADTPLTKDFSKTSQDITLQLNGMYGDLAGFNCFKNAIIHPLIVGADNYSGSAGDAANFGQKLYTPQGRWFVESWDTFYRIINNVNTLLPLLEEADVPAAFRDKIKGNLYFLRGFSYFFLVRMFGGVPIRTEPVSAQSDFYLPRNSRDDVYDLLLTDLEQASSLLPLYSELPAGEFGNATKGAAQALLALAYLTYGNRHDLAGNTAAAVDAYTQASAYADEVILSGEYALLENYADLWDIENEQAAYREVIFGIPYTRDKGASLAASLGSEIGTWTRGGGQWRVQPWFYDQCTTGDYEGDYRADATFLTFYINENNGREFVTYPVSPGPGQGTTNQPFLAKYIDPAPVDNRNRENDFPIIRLAEVYLIKAEAENELHGPTGAAAEAFNQLRARARKADGTPRETPLDIDPTMFTKESFRQKIFEERGFELFGEGQRWFDLVRMKAPTGTTMFEYQYTEILPNFEQGLPAYNANNGRWNNRRVAPNTAVPFQEKYLLFPIPVSEIGVNPFAEQNPGW